MSRIQKLYNRLDELERQLEIRILAELDRVACGELSRYFQRRISNLWDGRANRTAEVAKLEHLTHEVIALKEKLEEPISSGVTGIVLFFENFRSLPWDQRPSTEEQINLVRRKIKELRSQIKQRRP